MLLAVLVDELGRCAGLIGILGNIVGVCGVVVVDYGQIVGAEYHILSGNGNGAAVRGLEQVVSRKHKEASLCLSLCRKRNMDCHLVAVEVGVECGTNKRMKPYGSALDKHRLECLDTEAVKRGSTVEHDGVILDDYLKSIPHCGVGALDHLTGGFDVARDLGLDKALHNEGLEELESHLFGKTALIELEVRSDDDNRTAGVVDTLTEQVLSETSLLTFQHIRKGFKRPVVGAGNGSASSAVVDKGVNGLLKHSLLVPDDYLGGAELHKLCKTAVSVDNASVKVVKVGGGESAALELNHGADLRRDNRDNVEDHPLRSVAGLSEGFDDLKALERLCFLLAGGALHLGFKLL